ncbi:hypothetical protein VW29_04615 [Devosia limi DSM 17137]|uniref:Two-component system, chemotaxis family, response regulator CheY n=1 Tax=Devosia limi DSM 17137 TaxID=1121477 RepID=A0A0F5LUS0_9HYPH|nr:response regulator [Devosia limi]KKB86021.1 hypothetical protein VW29_04615 [Devosia limi DSM 17137]SHG00515.1 two-component system, chemotaxis family, response regulator CheY [Devosia limi DSM 17137]
MIIAGRLRALVVDDNIYARAISSASLKKLGVGQIEEADGGAQAILMLMGAPYDLVLMDWYMPDISGAGVLTVMRDARFGAASKTPVILMTAYPSRENLQRARETGINEVLVKPFTTEQLGVALGRVLTPDVPTAGDADKLFL